MAWSYRSLQFKIHPDFRIGLDRQTTDRQTTDRQKKMLHYGDTYHTTASSLTFVDWTHLSGRVSMTMFVKMFPLCTVYLSAKEETCRISSTLSPQVITMFIILVPSSLGSKTIYSVWLPLTYVCTVRQNKVKSSWVVVPLPQESALTLFGLTFYEIINGHTRFLWIVFNYNVQVWFWKSSTGGLGTHECEARVCPKTSSGGLSKSYEYIIISNGRVQRVHYFHSFDECEARVKRMMKTILEKRVWKFIILYIWQPQTSTIKI